jgi:putative transposase
MKDLSKREYKCNKCGLELDRDINASVNIMFEGIKELIKKDTLLVK